MEKITRKEFLQRLALLGLGSVGAGSLLNSCGGGGDGETQTQQPASQPEAAADPCNDLSGFTEDEIKMRETFKYVAESTEPEKFCYNCQLYIEPKEGEPCGGCQIIKGPIHPNGWCMQWVAKVSS